MNDEQTDDAMLRETSLVARAIPGTERTWYRVTVEVDVLAKDAVEAGQVATGPDLTARERRVASVVPRGFQFPLRLGDAGRPMIPSVFGDSSPTAVTRLDETETGWPARRTGRHTEIATHCAHRDDHGLYCCVCRRDPRDG